MMSKRTDIGSTHLFIPDTQIQQGVPLEHLEAVGNYIVDKQPETIIMAMDWWDMPSLSTYETSGSKYFHDKSYRQDIDAGLEGMELFFKPIDKYNAKMKRNKMKQYKPRIVATLGNHEHRIIRAVNTQPILEGTVSLDDLQLDKFGIEWYPYQKIVDIDGILYSHNFVNQTSLTKGIIGGTIQNKLHKIGQSFTMGHQQIRQIGDVHFSNGNIARGLVWGAFYQHDEHYMGEQGNHYPRGCAMKYEVKDGDYCLLELSIDYLMRQWL